MVAEDIVSPDEFAIIFYFLQDFLLFEKFYFYFIYILHSFDTQHIIFTLYKYINSTVFYKILLDQVSLILVYIDLLK